MASNDSIDAGRAPFQFRLHTGTYRKGLVAIVSSTHARVKDSSQPIAWQEIDCKGGSALHNDDTSLLCCSGDRLLCYKLETKQEQTFKVPSAVQFVCPADKYDTTSEIAYVVGDKFLGLMDSRVGRCVISINYTTPQKFSCVATTFNGCVAGTEDGFINFYKRIGQCAMTKLDVTCHVRSIDATVDGDFIVAGTASDVLLMNGNVDQKSAFTSRLAGSIKPESLLSLQEEEFVRSVKFDRPGISDDEGLIVAVTSARVVVWTLQQGKATFLTETDKPMVDCAFPLSDTKCVFTVDDQGVQDEWVLA